LTKLSVILTLVLSGGLSHAAAGPFAAGGPSRLGFVDGVSRKAAARRPRANKVRAADRGRRVKAAAARAAKVRPAPAGSATVVTPALEVREVNAEGLKQLLLQRGGGDAAQEARPLLVNFWATWCDPCREEMPDLVRIDSEFRPRGLDFILVSADDISEIKTGVPAFLKKMRATMPSYLLSTPDVEAAMTLVDERWGGELPATFLLDREGKIVFKHFGRVKLAELRPAIEKALGKK
jgi:thiol-disulfide isomerase/thioredoxin